MGRKRQTQRVDPELLRQLDAPSAASGPVEAVFTLKSGRGSARPSRPTETEAAVRRLLDRVAAEVGVAPSRSNVFRHLDAFVVVAPARFVRTLMAQDEIATATANRQPSSMAIPPRSRRPA
jgi:hypothetical protein